MPKTQDSFMIIANAGPFGYRVEWSIIFDYVRPRLSRALKNCNSQFVRSSPVHLLIRIIVGFHNPKVHLAVKKSYTTCFCLTVLTLIQCRSG